MSHFGTLLLLQWSLRQELGGNDSFFGLGRVRIKIRIRVRVRVGVTCLILAFIIGAIVAGANVVHSSQQLKHFKEQIPTDERRWNASSSVSFIHLDDVFISFKKNGIQRPVTLSHLDTAWFFSISFKRSGVPKYTILRRAFRHLCLTAGPAYTKRKI